MTIVEIIKETPITLAEVKSELEKAQKRDGELTFRGNKTLEHVSQCTSLNTKKVKELREKLVAAESRLKEQHIVKLIDVLPTSIEDVRLVLQGYTIQIKEDTLKKIVEAIKEVA